MDSARRSSRFGPPKAVVAVAAVAGALLVLPLLGLILRSPWSRFADLLAGADFVQPLLLSLLVASAATMLAATFGIPLAWVLARGAFPGRRILRALITVPMVLPPVVAGIGLLTAFGRNGLLGGGLDALGVQLPFSAAGAIVAAAFVGAPFLILSLESGFYGVDEDREDAARTLGAGEWSVFTRVTLPSLRPALMSGAALAFARALGEFGATITFAGSVRGRTQTAPLAVFEIFQSDPEAAIMLSLVMLAFSLLLIYMLRARIEQS